MYGKKIFLVIVFLFLLGGTLFCDDFNIKEINGVWLTPKDLNNYLSNPKDQRYISYYLWDEGYIIFWDKTTKEGVFQRGREWNSIQTVEIVGKKATIKFFDRGRDSENEIVLEYVSRNLLCIISNLHKDDDPATAGACDYLCRVSDFDRLPKAKARINNNRVNLRNKPELSSDVWFTMDLGEEVGILGISAEKQAIGELEAYWYEVRVKLDGILSGGGLDGWVFGAYLDVENRAELEEKLKKLRRDGG